MTGRDVGGMGEGEFKKWCNGVGLAANKFHEDKTGKDFLVEFPFDESAKHIHEAPITARVQVKSTDKGRRKEQITVSNLKRLATELGPSFIVFIEFDGKDNPTEAFVVHVDDDWTTKILKRVQEVNNPSSAIKKKKKKKSKKGKRGPKKKQQDGPALNKTKMTVSYDESNKILQPNGESLRSAIEAAVPQGMHKYVEDKKKHLESTGYEDGYGTFKFSVEGERDISGLIDLSLGLKESVEVKDPIFTPKRFGIVTTKDVSQHPTGWLVMPNLQPMSKGVLKFFNAETLAPLVFEVDVYTSPFNNSIHREFVKIRIVGSNFEILLHPFTGKIHFKCSIDTEPTEIRLLHSLLRLMLVFEKIDQSTCMRLCIEGFPDFAFRASGKDSVKKFNINTADLANAAKAANMLISEFEITETVDATLDELQKESSNLQGMATIFSQENMRWRSVFAGESLATIPDKKLAAVCFASARIGEYAVGLFLVTCGKPKKVAEGHYLETSECHLEDRMVSERGKFFDCDEQIRLLQKIIDRYQDDYQLSVMCSEEVGKRLKFKDQD